mmetsp:Transcript_39331/g.95631  ORF Transcript_39331/g.95631 Transcript_39331/m.95631 type:complete len:289 (+) Transcript_39331:466-1332(+)
MLIQPPAQRYGLHEGVQWLLAPFVRKDRWTHRDAHFLLLLRAAVGTGQELSPSVLVLLGLAHQVVEGVQDNDNVHQENDVGHNARVRLTTRRLLGTDHEAVEESADLGNEGIDLHAVESALAVGHEGEEVEGGEEEDDEASRNLAGAAGEEEGHDRGEHELAAHFDHFKVPELHLVGGENRADALECDALLLGGPVPLEGADGDDLLHRQALRLFHNLLAQLLLRLVVSTDHFEGVGKRLKQRVGGLLLLLLLLILVRVAKLGRFLDIRDAAIVLAAAALRRRRGVGA